jgi:hypothetical protein
VGKFKEIKKLWEFAKRNLTTEEIKSKLILVTDDEGRTGWFFAAEWASRET